MALTYQQIADATVCYGCLRGFEPQVFTHLLAQWAGGSTDPRALATASAPFQSIAGGRADAAASYMLSVIAGAPNDPGAASQSAACFECLDSIQMRSQIYLLAVAVGGSTDPQTLVTQSSAFQILPDFTSVILYLLQQKSGVTMAQIAEAIPCWSCLQGQQGRVQSFFFDLGTTPTTECVVIPDEEIATFSFSGFVSTACLEFSVLTSVFGTFNISSNASLERVDFLGLPLSFRVPNTIISGNPLLTEISFAGSVVATSPSSRIFTFTNNALTQSSVDGVLMAIDAGLSSGDEIHLEGGTNSTPGAAGIAAIANLSANGWVVTTN